MKEIAIIMGSDSDLPIMAQAENVLKQFGIGYEITVVSAHRTPKRLYNFAENARKNGFDVIIAGAGGAAHLPGMVASLTSLPVIGVPIQSKALSGLDSLLSIVQMPKGVPVASVAINGAANAALLAIKILAAKHPNLHGRLQDYMGSMESEVLNKANKLSDLGGEAYLKS